MHNYRYYYWRRNNHPLPKLGASALSLSTCHKVQLPHLQNLPSSVSLSCSQGRQGRTHRVVDLNEQVSRCNSLSLELDFCVQYKSNLIVNAPLVQRLYFPFTSATLTWSHLIQRYHEMQLMNLFLACGNSQKPMSSILKTLKIPWLFILHAVLCAKVREQICPIQKIVFVVHIPLQPVTAFHFVSLEQSVWRLSICVTIRLLVKT